MMKMVQEKRSGDFYSRAVRRIGWLTLLFGLLAAAIVTIRAGRRAGEGVAAGTCLAWLSYHWLDRATQALLPKSRTSGKFGNPRVPLRVYLQLIGRYILIALAAYVIVFRFNLPALSVLGGLLALGAGAMAEGLYEIVTGWE